VEKGGEEEVERWWRKRGSKERGGRRGGVGERGGKGGGGEGGSLPFPLLAKGRNE